MDNYKELFDIHSTTNKEALVNKLMERAAHSTRRNTRVFKPALIAAVIALTILVSGTTYAASTGLLQNLFGNNPAVLENIQEEVNFEVLSNSFEGVEFEVIGLYADDDSILLMIEAIAEEALFTDEKVFIGSGMIGLTDYAPGVFPKGFISSESHIYRIDEHRLTLLWYFSGSVTGVNPGTTHTLTIKPLLYDVYDSNGFVLLVDEEGESMISTGSIEGRAEIMFIVGDLIANNHIRLSPNIELESGDVLIEVVVNPFNIIFFLEGVKEYETFNADESYIRMRDGTIKELDFCRENSIITRMTGGLTYKSTHYGISHPTFLHLSFTQDQTVVINDIEAIVYKSIEILVP